MDKGEKRRSEKLVKINGKDMGKIRGESKIQVTTENEN